MNPLTLTPKRHGAWLANITKHLVDVPQTDIALSSIENIIFAGKCGSLLIKLSGDETEQLTLKKVKGHANVSGIVGPELSSTLSIYAA